MMQLTCFLAAEGAADALDAFARRRRTSVKPRPRTAPTPSWRKSRRGMPAQLPECGVRNGECGTGIADSARLSRGLFMASQIVNRYPSSMRKLDGGTHVHLHGTVDARRRNFEQKITKIRKSFQ